MNKKEEKTNELILAALERLLEKKSYTDISVSDIILESTVSRSTFYTHYKKKDDVLNELKRWSVGVDMNNLKMLEMENKFINVLETL